MSLDTLLEAARYIELQELKEQQQNRRLETAVTSQHVEEPARPPTSKQSPVGFANATAALWNNGAVTSAVLPQLSIKQEINNSVQQNRAIHNSFDIINPLVIDESSGEPKRKQPPLAFRSGTREVHNKLEKHRRAHLKECFDILKKQLPPSQDEKKTSNLSILHSALRHIQLLKRNEREMEHELERLAREKISFQQRLAILKKDISSHCDSVDFSKLLSETPSPRPSSPDQRVEQQPVSNDRVPISPLPRSHTQFASMNGTKEPQQQPVQTALSVVPVQYSQGLVLQKVALVPKGLTELSPLVSSPTVAHFITAPQQLNGKVVPLVNAQYVVKPVVVVSTASRTS